MITAMASGHHIFPIVAAATRTWNHVINRGRGISAINTATTIAGEDCAPGKWNRVTIWNAYKFI
jgi:hypothetical protein